MFGGEPICAEIVPVGKDMAIVDVADASIDDMFDDLVNVDGRLLLQRKGMSQAIWRAAVVNLPSCGGGRLGPQPL